MVQFSFSNEGVLMDGERKRLLVMFMLSTFISSFVVVTTLAMVVAFFMNKEAFNLAIFIYPLWFVVNWYFQTMHQFEKRGLPTSALYRSRVPLVAASALSWVIIGIVVYFMLFK